MKRTTKLKEMLQSGNLEFIMEAHNGLSSKIVEEAGFKGIWASGLSISASQGVRDSNELSWTEVASIWEKMADAVNIPILVDADTGFGDFNSARMLIKKLEKIGIAGCCIEDKLFPKTNSFIGENQSLADMHEHALKIRAMKDTQQDPDFCVVARLEAFIAGLGLEEALKRAHAYAEAGADAILCHSKKSTVVEIEQFMNAWNASMHSHVPVVIVPTKYYTVPTDKYRELGISMVIWANHNIRACITAMQHTTKTIFETESLIDIEDRIAAVSEIFRLQNDEELRLAENQYLPTKGRKVKAVILAAAKGQISETEPKALLSINGTRIHDTQTDLFNRAGITDIVTVVGYGAEQFTSKKSKYIKNENWQSTKDLASLYEYMSKNEPHELIISYGDIIFKKHILEEILESKNDITLIADSDIDRRTNANGKDYIITAIDSKAGARVPVEFGDYMYLGSTCDKAHASGEFIGLWRVTKEGYKIVMDALVQLSQSGIESLTCTDLFSSIVNKDDKSIHVQFIRGGWVDIDTYSDAVTASNM